MTMTPTNNTKTALILLLLWWLSRRKETVTTGIDFPASPDGTCYDAETDSYYVGDC